MKIQFAFRNFANALRNLRPVPLPRFKPSISRSGNLTNQMLLRVVWFKRAQDSFSGGKAADGVKLVTHIRLCLDHCMAFSPLKRKVQPNLGSRTPRITNNSVYEQIFRTQNVSDEVLCFELRTRKPSKRRQKQITMDNF